MLVCFGLFGLLLYNTVVANAVCSFTYSREDRIQAASQDYEIRGFSACEYRIQAPKNNYIELNFTRLFGFQPLPSMPPGSVRPSTNIDPSVCPPPQVLIKESPENIHEGLPVGQICKNYKHFQGPKVFHSKLNSLNIVYYWVEHQASGFTLEFNFHILNSTGTVTDTSTNECVQTCDESRCLEERLICNNVYDCEDKTDESSCVPIPEGTGQTQSSSIDFIKIIVIIISVVLMPGLFIIVCVVCPCRLRSRMLRRRRSRDRLEHSQLRPHSSEVVYVPAATSQDQLLDKPVSLVRGRQVPVKSEPPDPAMLEYPPQIPISRDGEEGYVQSQKELLYMKRSHELISQQCFRPPPNRTVMDRESPPPYYSNSASLDTLNKQSPARIVRDSNGCPVMYRCYSMSSNGSSTQSTATSRKHGQQSPTSSKTHARTMSTNYPPVRSRTVSTSSAQFSLDNNEDEPPDFTAVFSSSHSNSSERSSVNNNV